MYVTGREIEDEVQSDTPNTEQPANLVVLP